MVAIAFRTCIWYSSLIFTEMTEEHIVRIVMHSHEQVTRRATSGPAAITTDERTHSSTTIECEEDFFSFGEVFLHLRHKYL